VTEPIRCWTTSDPAYNAYHDDEWGRPVDDDVRLYEKFCLEGFQSGLSWLTILRKRDSFRAAFRGFDPVVVANFDDDDRERLMADAGIVRNRAKVDATIDNARAFLLVIAELGSFHDYVTAFVGSPPPRLPSTANPGDIPATTPASDALSKDLKKRGFRFVGSTIVYAFMQAAGFVDDHLPGCFLYRGA